MCHRPAGGGQRSAIAEIGQLHPHQSKMLDPLSIQEILDNVKNHFELHPTVSNSVELTFESRT